ncbi:MAG: hypothetical protein V2I24_05765, partial [Halieaceae bacterium]|nr:hypothetical protein [Halieaceae bacterium]
DRIDQPLGDELRTTLRSVGAADFESGRIRGDGSIFALSRKTNASFSALNDVLSRGGTAGLARDTIETVNGIEPGAIIVRGLERETLQTILEDNRIDAVALGEAPAATSLNAARVGIYRPWGGNQYDAGWTRWVLEQYGFNPGSVYDSDVRNGDLAKRYDTILVPDLAASRPLRKADLEARMQELGIPEPYRRKGPLGVLLDGLSPLEVPESYAGGIGDKGGEMLRRFVWEGGSLVALNKASEAIIDLFELPVTNVLRGLDSNEFSCAGALLQIELADPAAATGGLPDRPAVMFAGGPAFQTKAGFDGKVLARFAEADSLLLSGVIIGPEKIQGKSAALEVSYGQGRIYLFGFKPQWRGQSHGTYKMLFNLLYRQG